MDGSRPTHRPSPEIDLHRISRISPPISLGRRARGKPPGKPARPSRPPDPHPCANRKRKTPATPRMRPGRPSGRRQNPENKRQNDRTLNGMGGRTNDMVGAVIFLASNAGSCASGEAFFLAGGYRAPRGSGAERRPAYGWWNTGSIAAHHSPFLRVANGVCSGSQIFHQSCIAGFSAMLAMSASKSSPVYSQ